MRKADLRKNHAEFDDTLQKYVEFLGRVFGSRLTREDKRKMAEATLLRVCAHWESFVEKELVDCVNIDCSRLSEYADAPLPKHLTIAMCRAILFGGRYLDFQSVGALKGFAKRVLPDHVNPFKEIGPATGKQIDNTYTIRNYLSHQSQMSRRALMRMYREQYGLKTFRRPGGFLLANNYDRLAMCLAGFSRASKEMARIIPKAARPPAIRIGRPAGTSSSVPGA